MNAYIKRDDVLKALILTDGKGLSETLSAVMDLPIVDIDEKDREIEKLKKAESKIRDTYIAHLKQDITDIVSRGKEARVGIYG